MSSSKVITGIGVGAAAVVAPCVRFQRRLKAPTNEAVPATPSAQDEAARTIADALEAVASDLERTVRMHEGQVLGDVLAATAEIARDPELRDRSISLMREGVGPANAITQVVAQFAEMFVQLGGYMAERVVDLNSVRDGVVARILGAPQQTVSLIKPSVIIADELTPSDTAQLDMSRVVGLVTQQGGPTSHTAIIARQRGLPCVVRAEGASDIPDGCLIAVDSRRGTVTINPDRRLQDSIRLRIARREALAADTAPASTLDGHPMQLLANIATVEDAEYASRKAADGVGLFRTEFMFLDAESEPSIDAQFDCYRQVLAHFRGRKVVVRTLDVGVDKPLLYANSEHEDNPALGVRAYRLMRRIPHLLDHQLIALAQAIQAVPDTDTWVMAPMISTPDEASDFAQRAHAVGIRRVGIMVEVPAAALTANEMLSHVDFGSLGTNDLAQYTMATDRQLGSLADLLDPWQPAVLRLIELTARAGTSLGKPVGVCGESASDPLMALVLCGLGITSLSMSTAAIAEVRYALRHTTFSMCQRMASAAVNATSVDQARNEVESLLSTEVRETLMIDRNSSGISPSG